jgi:hypothetical protein
LTPLNESLGKSFFSLSQDSNSREAGFELMSKPVGGFIVRSVGKNTNLDSVGAGSDLGWNHLTVIECCSGIVQRFG